MTAQEKTWKVIRGLNEFTFTEVCELTEESYKTISSYLWRLIRAGYIRHVGRRANVPKTRGHKVWRLIKNTGPRAPLQRRCIYDPNTNTVAGMEGDNVD